MAAYVDMDFVKLVGSMPASDIDAVELIYPGTFAAIAESVSRQFDARLAKRYAVPYAADKVPEVVRWNVTQVVVAALWQKRGYNPGSAQDEIIRTNKAEALEWLKEAADSEKGLVELLVKDTSTEAVTKTAPLAYSEQSPYVWTDLQREDGRDEDRNT